MSLASQQNERGYPIAIDSGEYYRLQMHVDEFGLERMTDMHAFAAADLTERFDINGQAAVKSLRAAGAVTVVGERTIGSGNHTRTVNVYSWVDGVADWIDEQVDEQNTLPCGCRAHIYKLDGELTCKFCAESGDAPTFDRETVKEAMADD